MDDLTLVAVVAVALFFDFTNGFHDTANSIATSVSTRALSPRLAVLMSAVLNFAGAFVSFKVAAMALVPVLLMPPVSARADGPEADALTGPAPLMTARPAPSLVDLDAPASLRGLARPEGLTAVLSTPHHAMKEVRLTSTEKTIIIVSAIVVGALIIVGVVGFGPHHRGPL